jgi:hypothetical protein
VTEDRLSIGDAMAYGFSMLAYLLLVNLVGGTRSSEPA